jgi:hypothetical protein
MSLFKSRQTFDIKVMKENPLLAAYSICSFWDFLSPDFRVVEIIRYLLDFDIVPVASQLHKRMNYFFNKGFFFFFSCL